MIPTKYGPAGQIPFGCTTASTALAAVTTSSVAARRHGDRLSLCGCAAIAATTKTLSAAQHHARGAREDRVRVQWRTCRR